MVLYYPSEIERQYSKKPECEQNLACSGRCVLTRPSLLTT